MDKLERFFEDIHAIRETLEMKINEEKEGVALEVFENTKEPVEEPTVQPVNSAQIPTAPTTVIPTAYQVESFTQEQIALAMSNAIAVGRRDIVDKILTTYNAQCLMQIEPTNYNQIAVMLREAGIQV